MAVVITATKIEFKCHFIPDFIASLLDKKQKKYLKGSFQCNI